MHVRIYIPVPVIHFLSSAIFSEVTSDDVITVRSRVLRIQQYPATTIVNERQNTQWLHNTYLMLRKSTSMICPSLAPHMTLVSLEKAQLVKPDPNCFCITCNRSKRYRLAQAGQWALETGAKSWSSTSSDSTGSEHGTSATQAGCHQLSAVPSGTLHDLLHSTVKSRQQLK